MWPFGKSRFDKCLEEEAAARREQRELARQVTVTLTSPRIVIRQGDGIPSRRYLDLSIDEARSLKGMLTLQLNKHDQGE